MLNLKYFFQGSINGHLFFIKHLLIIREQIAPFDVDFAVKEVALDFSKMKTAAFGLLSKGTRLLSLSSNNAILEFLLEVGIRRVIQCPLRCVHLLLNLCSGTFSIAKKREKN